MVKATMKNIKKQFTTSKKGAKKRLEACKRGKLNAKITKCPRNPNVPPSVRMITAVPLPLAPTELDTEGNNAMKKALDDYVRSFQPSKPQRASKKMLKAFFDTEPRPFTFELFSKCYKSRKRSVLNYRRRASKPKKEFRLYPTRVKRYEWDEETDTLVAIRAPYLGERVKGSTRDLKEQRKQMTEKILRRKPGTADDYKKAHLYQFKKADPDFKSVTERVWEKCPDPIIVSANEMRRRYRYNSERLVGAKRKNKGRKRDYAFRKSRQSRVREIKDAAYAKFLNGLTRYGTKWGYTLLDETPILGDPADQSEIDEISSPPSQICKFPAFSRTGTKRKRFKAPHTHGTALLVTPKSGLINCVLD